jgi:hypothetical protein
MKILRHMKQGQESENRMILNISQILYNNLTTTIILLTIKERIHFKMK